MSFSRLLYWHVLLCGTYILFDLIWFVIIFLHIIRWRLSVSINDILCYVMLLNAAWNFSVDRRVTQTCKISHWENSNFSGSLCFAASGRPLVCSAWHLPSLIPETLPAWIASKLKMPTFLGHMYRDAHCITVLGLLSNYTARWRTHVYVWTTCPGSLHERAGAAVRWDRQPKRFCTFTADFTLHKALRVSNKHSDR